MNKPFSAACERNRDPIFDVLRQYIKPEHTHLLEIGSGTGQHAVYFAPHFKHMTWITSDVPAHHLGMVMWFKEFKIPNISGPIRFKVGIDEFPKQPVNIVYTANTFHIMSWKNVKTLMKMFGHRLRKNSLVMIYGPFNYDGKFTSPSNEQFDRMLKEENPDSGIRNFEDVNKAMIKNGFELLKDHEMPANNRMLIYKRLEHLSSPV